MGTAKQAPHCRVEHHQISHAILLKGNKMAGEIFLFNTSLDGILSYTGTASSPDNQAGTAPQSKSTVKQPMENLKCDNALLVSLPVQVTNHALSLLIGTSLIFSGGGKGEGGIK